MLDKKNFYINGKWVAPKNPKEIEVINPSTEKSCAVISLGGKDDVNAAVTAAKNALESWTFTPKNKRVELLEMLYVVYKKRWAEIADAITLEMGAPKDFSSQLQTGTGASHIKSFTRYLKEFNFEKVLGDHAKNQKILYEPKGVCALITPWNWPMNQVCLKVIPALAAGCTMVLKPSELAPLSAMILAEMIDEVKFPDGVFNIINGDKEVVDAILVNKDIKAVSFVGSTPIAKYIYENAAKNEKRVQALGGAKNHCVVMPDCDLDQAVNGLMGAAYGSAGERCMAQSVAVAVGDIGDSLVGKLTKKVEALKIGPGMDKTSEMGPLVTKEHLDKVKGYVDLGVKEGAKLLVDGRNLKLQGYEKGFYIGGCLFDYVKKDMRIYKEEIFGPVLSVVRVKDFNEATQLVNDHEYGNGVSIYTRDGDVGRTFASKIKVGMVGINIPIPVPVAFHSFGGWKRSLFGDQHMHGPEGVRFYTKLKTITSRWPSGIRSNPEFIMPTMK